MYIKFVLLLCSQVGTQNMQNEACKMALGVHSKEGPEGVKWELGFACFCTGKMGFWSLGLGFEWEKKPKWEWDWCFVSISVGSGHWLVGFGKKCWLGNGICTPPFRTLSKGSNLSVKGELGRFPLHLIIYTRGARVAHWWEHSPSTSVGRVQIPASTPYVGWVCCWFSPLLREIFPRVVRFSPLLKNQQHFQIPIRSGTHGHV